MANPDLTFVPKHGYHVTGLPRQTCLTHVCPFCRVADRDAEDNLTAEQVLASVNQKPVVVTWTQQGRKSAPATQRIHYDASELFGLPPLTISWLAVCEVMQHSARNSATIPATTTLADLRKVYRAALREKSQKEYAPMIDLHTIARHHCPAGSVDLVAGFDACAKLAAKFGYEDMQVHPADYAASLRGQHKAHMRLCYNDAPVYYRS